MSSRSNHMPAGILTGVILPAIHPLHPPILRRPNRFLTLTMGSQAPASQKRPFCLRCSKPARLCLCTRITTPPLDNPIAVTILQHNLERNHPLNSTRVARLGLRNLVVLPVSDVNFHAHLLIRPLRPAVARNPPDKPPRLEISTTHFAISPDSDHRDMDGVANPECSNGHECIRKNFDKYSVACSDNDIRITVHRSVKPDVRWVLDSPISRAVVSNGFLVKKLQRKQLLGNEEFQEFEEFEVAMPPGSAVLFPSKRSISLEEVDFEVKQLVVLDGTWAKATRIYHENPWLQFLPHLKLDLGRESLYSEVRHQPKAGCLSTIESIVCAMKGLGCDMEGLDNLLEVFESMIGDQRRCKDEKFRAMSMS